MDKPLRKILYGVYDADGGLWGELKYIFGKVSGQTRCTLCDLTHGWSPRGKKDWSAFINEQAFEFLLVHRNEQVGELKKVTSDRTPCIVQKVDDRYTLIIDPEELGECQGDLEKFKTLLVLKIC